MNNNKKYINRINNHDKTRFYNINNLYDFNPIVYKNLHLDLINMTDNEAKLHYVQYGKQEGRIYKQIIPALLNEQTISSNQIIPALLNEQTISSNQIIPALINKQTISSNQIIPALINEQTIIEQTEKQLYILEQINNQLSILDQHITRLIIPNQKENTLNENHLMYQKENTLNENHLMYQKENTLNENHLMNQKENTLNENHLMCQKENTLNENHLMYQKENTLNENHLMNQKENTLNENHLMCQKENTLNENHLMYQKENTLNENHLMNQKENTLNENQKDYKKRVFIVIDCQSIQHEERGIGRYCIHIVNTIIRYTDFKIKLIVNNFLPNDNLSKIKLRDGVKILEVNFKNVLNKDNHERNIYYIDNEDIYETQIAKIINTINPYIYINLSDIDRRKVNININLLNKNIKTFSILYDLIPLKNGWLPSMDIKMSNKYMEKLEQLKRYTKLLCISEFTKKDCSDIFSNMEIIGTGAEVENKKYTDQQIKNTLNKFKINKRYIFCQTTFSENKTLHLLFYIYNKLSDLIKNDILLVFGVGHIPTNYLKTHNMLNSNVIITGYLNEDDLWILHDNAWLFVFPSSYEGFGLPAVESMWHNKPVIVAKNTSLIEIMSNDKYMFNNNDDSCLELINKFYNDKIFYDECREYCYNRKDLFTWKNVFYKLTHTIYSVLKNDNINNSIWQDYDILQINSKLKSSVINKSSINSLINNKNLFYYVDTIHTYNFNTGIQKIAKNLSNIINNFFNGYNLFLVNYCELTDDLKLLNENELKIYYNDHNNTDFNDKQQLFNIIKKNNTNITLFIPEIIHTNLYNPLNKIIVESKLKGYNTSTIYYHNNYMELKLINEYISTISNIDLIIFNSEYSKTTYLNYKKKLNIETIQREETVLLSGELFPHVGGGKFKRIKKKCKTEDNYIFMNINMVGAKGDEPLISVFNRLHNEYPFLKLYINDSINNEHKTTENIIFFSNKTDEEIYELYKNALFSVYPFIDEGLGIPIYESLWCCTPIICHNDMSSLEISTNINSDSVICIDCLNEEILYSHMKKLMDKEYLTQISINIEAIKIRSLYNYTNEIINKINLKYKISVILILYNNIEWFKYLIKKLKQVEKEYNIYFEYFIYENNSCDEFKLLLNNFINNNEGKLMSELLTTIKYESIISVNRGIHMNYIRNKNKLNHGFLTSNFTLLLDSDIFFNISVIPSLMEHLTNNKNISMISGYVLYRNNNLNNDNKYHYYDTLAFSTDKYNFKNIDNTCLFEKCNKCKNHRQTKNINIDNKDLIKYGSIIKVNSLFGSLSLIPTNIYNKVSWNDNYGFVETDHYGLCQELKKYGDLVLNTNIKYIKNKNKY